MKTSDVALAPALAAPIEYPTATIQNYEQGGAGLPEPVLNSRSPTDLLGMMMALSESMNRASAQHTEQQIMHNQAKLDKALEEFNAKMAEALRNAQMQEEKADNGGGLFGIFADAVDAVCDFIAEVVGTVIGTVADFALDLATAPLDLVKGLIDGKSIQQILESERDALLQNGSVARIAQDCAKGVMKFVADVVKFANSAAAVIEAGVNGQDVGQALKTQCEAVVSSFKENILDNAAVMKVVSVALKVVAVVATAVSGGILAPIAIALVILSDLDQRFGIAKAICKGDEQAAKWVSLGIQLAAAVCMSAAGGSADLGEVANTILDVAVVVSAVSTAVEAVRTFDDQNRVADAQDLQADVREVLNRMERLQRVIDTLLEELGRKMEDGSRLIKDGAELYRTQGATLEAAVIRA
jgi:hypothetical protein